MVSRTRSSVAEPIADVTKQSLAIRVALDPVHCTGIGLADEAFAWLISAPKQ